MRYFRTALLCIGLALAWALLLAYPAPAGGGETQTDAFIGIWKLTLTPDSDAQRDGAKTFKEAIMFENGELMAENFASYGFSPAAYTIPEDQPQKFSASLTSNTKGTLTWSGTVNSCKLSGELIWIKQDGTVWKFKFCGTK